MYNDIIRFMEKDVKGDDVLSKKFNCSPCQITKLRRKMSDIFQRKLKSEDLKVGDFF